jgi:cytochrome d ubiquinol oxidase subunit I
VAPLFWSFRIMVGTGVLMLAVSWIGAWQLRRGGAVRPWLRYALIAMTFSGWIATIAGWYVTEIGRQPWLVSGVLRTADAASNVPAPMIGLSLAAYLTLYVVLLLSYVTVLFHMARKAGAGQAPAPARLAPEA